MSKNGVFYYIEVELQNRNVYVTNNKKDITINSIKYLSSNMEISEISSDDFGKDNITVKGFYDKNLSYNDISNKMNFTIFFVVDSDFSNVKTLGQYSCEKAKKDNLQYFIELKCKTHILEKSFLSVYTKECRAEFGDFRCKKNIADFSKVYRALSINSDIINLENILEDDQYYKNGDVEIKKLGRHFKCRVVSQINNIVLVDSAIPEFFIGSEYVELIAGCDKKILTCCKKFNNVINFRGEPFVNSSIKSIYKFMNSIKNEK